MRNIATSLRRRPARHPMRHYDRLPPALRHWLSHAALPWSPASALKLWRRLERRHGGDGQMLLAAMNRAEARMLCRDSPQIWGAGYPVDVRGA